MIIEKNIMKTEAKFSDDKKNRFTLSKEWSNKKSRALLISIHPSIGSEITLDLTTLLVINELEKLGFGAVDIVNLFPKIFNKLVVEEVDSKEISENDTIIVELAEKTNTIILGWGRIGEKSKAVKQRQNELLTKLVKYKDKIFVIGNDNNEEFLHPLSPKARKKGWKLIKVKL